MPTCHQIISAAMKHYARHHAFIEAETPSGKGRQGRELFWKVREGKRPKSHMVESSPSPKFEAKLAGFHVLARLLSCVSFLLKAHAGCFQSPGTERGCRYWPCNFAILHSLRAKYALNSNIKPIMKLSACGGNFHRLLDSSRGPSTQSPAKSKTLLKRYA